MHGNLTIRVPLTLTISNCNFFNEYLVCFKNYEYDIDPLVDHEVACKNNITSTTTRVLSY
jgi:hypothetical protein